MATTKIHYPAEWAARGGPIPNGPLVAEASNGWVDMGAVALVVLEAGHPQNRRFAVIDSVGNVLAESDDANELANYLADYAAALQEEMESVE